MGNQVPTDWWIPTKLKSPLSNELSFASVYFHRTEKNQWYLGKSRGMMLTKSVKFKMATNKQKSVILVIREKCAEGQSLLFLMTPSSVSVYFHSTEKRELDWGMSSGTENTKIGKIQDGHYLVTRPYALRSPPPSTVKLPWVKVAYI